MKGIDLNDPASVENPHAYWSHFRELGPVQWSDAHRAWVILDHVELSEAFRDGRLLSADRVTPLERVAQRSDLTIRLALISSSSRYLTLGVEPTCSADATQSR